MHTNKRSNCSALFFYFDRKGRMCMQIKTHTIVMCHIKAEDFTDQFVHLTFRIEAKISVPSPFFLEFKVRELFVLRKYFSLDHFYYFLLPTVLLDSVLDFYLRHFPLWQNYWLETFVEFPFSGNNLKTQVENCSSSKHNWGWKRKVLGLPTMPVLSSVAAHSQLWLLQFPLVKLNGLP